MEPINSQSIHRAVRPNPVSPVRSTVNQVEQSTSRAKQVDTVEISAEAKAMLAAEQASADT